MYINLTGPHLVHELKRFENIQTAGSLRNQARILIIDDSSVSYLPWLQKSGFQVTHLTDVDDIRLVEPFQIIVCDIKGVGKAFGSSSEGGQLISEIKKHYPHKIVMAYSGQTYEPIFNRFFSLCDQILIKDDDSEVWVDALDQALTSYINPIESWKRIRAYLIERDISMLQLLELEDEYVTGILKQRSPFGNRKKLIGLPDEVQSVLIKFGAEVVTTFAIAALKGKMGQ